MKKILIMMASVGGLVGSGYAEVLFSSNFDGHNVAVDPSYVKDVTGQTTATVSWTTNGAVTAISDLSAITSGGGFVNQVQARTNLTAGIWTDVGDSLVATGSVSEIDVSMDGASSGSYYRVNVLQL